MVVGDFAAKKQLVIIGGGPGGYHAAIRAAQLGLDVLLVEKEKMGGVCLHKGCIPSKTLTHAAASFSGLAHLNQMGIQTGETSFQLDKLQNYQASIVENLQKGVEALIKANKVEYMAGTASFMTDTRIGIDSGHHFEMVDFEYALIATGAAPKLPDGIQLQDRILSTHTIWSLEDIPEQLIVYGHDYFALEAAVSYKSLGSDVTLVIPEDGFGMDASIEKELQRVLKKSKVKVMKNQLWKEAAVSENNVLLTTKKDKGESITVEGSHLLISGYYSPNLDNIGLDALKLDRDEHGRLIVNEYSQTSSPHIYAAGDCTIGPFLASKAIKQGKTAAEHMAGGNNEVNLALMPVIVHTQPPIAYAGLTEEEAVKQGYEVKVGQFSMSGNGYASILGQKEGLAKMVVDAKTDVLLGIHMMGAGAAELITAGTASLEMAAREEDVAYPIYAHPALSESWLEAAESLTEKAIHIPPAKKKEVHS